MPASLFFAAQVALLCGEAARWPAIRRPLGFGVILLAAVPPLVAMAVAVAKPHERLRFSGGPERTARELAPSQYQAPEYVPRMAREAGWIPFIKGGEILPGTQLEPNVTAGTATIMGFHREADALRVAGHAASPSALQLPQFWFPGWSISGSGGELTPDPATGLLRLALPPGPFDVVVERQPLPLARLSAIASLVVLGGVVILLLFPGQAALRGFSAARPGPVPVRRRVARLGAAWSSLNAWSRTPGPGLQMGVRPGPPSGRTRGPDRGGEREENLTA